MHADTHHHHQHYLQQQHQHHGEPGIETETHESRRSFSRSSQSTLALSFVSSFSSLRRSVSAANASSCFSSSARSCSNCRCGKAPIPTKTASKQNKTSIVFITQQPRKRNEIKNHVASWSMTLRDSRHEMIQGNIRNTRSRATQHSKIVFLGVMATSFAYIDIKGNTT